MSDNVLLYGEAGAWAVHERLRFGGTPAVPVDDRRDIAARPDVGVGVEGAITDRLFDPDRDAVRLTPIAAAAPPVA
ncbi:hypothetical protein HNR00_000882 [Methylorubrum rhodinum]|uniref:Uncharacterized protein n=1 Tax=Methylorubrum rhodinum TaxID=29428 RepID=A0A840ZF12_9HYPH|nr:hypothetical protein [Methylorubrum rhodinum]MBB5756186.1 hypothetical protein [Methylorubrum rhodinum]